MKKSKIKKLLALLMSLVMIVSVLPISGIVATASTALPGGDDDFGDLSSYEGESSSSFEGTSGNRITNEYLTFAVNDDRYSMYTTGGNPSISSDDNKRLLYGDLNRGTSRTFFRIGDSVYAFTPEYSLVNTAGDCVYSVQTISNIKIERYCTFVQNNETGRKDTLEVKYVTTNTGSTAKSVGTRIMFDTMLGDNDHAPFRVYEDNVLTDVTSEREFVGDDIPQHWYVFDSLSSPSVLASGTFYKNEREKPDKVQFILWGTASNDVFYNSINSSNFGDSAVNVYYNPASLDAGESKTVSTYYGISEFAAVEDDTEADVRLTNAIAPYSLEANEEGNDYQTNPFQFSAWISNSGDLPSTATEATLVLPEELSIEDQDSTIELGSIDGNSYKSVGWMISATPQAEEKEVTYSVVVSCEGEEDIVYDFTVSLPALDLMHECTPGDWVVTKEATCTEAGSKSKYCTECTAVVETEAIPALGHEYDSLEISVPVTNDKVDIAFAIDTTGSMSGDIAEVKSNMQAYLDALDAYGIDYRVAIVDYRDFAERTGYSADYAYKVDVDFSNNVSDIRSAINSLGLGNGGDTEETIYSALVDGLTSLHWRNDAGKAVIVMGDAGALDPEPYTGYTYEYVRNVLAGGTAPAGKTPFNTPVALFAIDSGSASAPLQTLAEETGGEYFTARNTPEISVIINKIISTITDTIFIPGSEWITRKEATCTENGEVYRTCLRCGYEDVRNIPALGHDISSEWITRKEATCTENGEAYRTCLRCEYEDVRSIPALGHDISEVVEIVDPKYGEDGYTLYKCVRCDETEKRDFVDALVSPARVVISNEVAKRDMEVTVSFTLEEAVPIKTILLHDFEFDRDILEIVEVRCMCDDTVIENWNPESEEAVMGFSTNTDSNGLVLEVVFRVKNTDDCISDVSCQVDATYAKAGSADKNIDVEVVKGSVKVYSGDVNGDGVLNTMDAIYLLKHTVLQDRYPIYCDADYDGDGYVTSDDAIYLLSHIMFPERYPLGGHR